MTLNKQISRDYLSSALVVRAESLSRTYRIARPSSPFGKKPDDGRYGRRIVTASKMVPSNFFSYAFQLRVQLYLSPVLT
jgi:hypothetical protein